MKKLMILATVVGLFAMVSMAWAQPTPGDIGVTFDEAGTLTMGTYAELGVPDASFPTFHIHVFAVTYGIVDLNAAEYSLLATGAAPFSVAVNPYGPAPQDFGSGYDSGTQTTDVRAGTGGCVNDATQMGADPNSWTLCDFDFNYFGDPGPDTYFCIQPSTSNTAMPEFPIYSGCDTVKHDMPPGNVDQAGVAPGGCAVLNPTQGQDVVGDEATSWGSLKAGF